MKNFILIFVMSLTCHLMAQSSKHQNQINILYKHALTKGKAYNWLDHLSNKIGGRLSGSLNAERSVKWGQVELKSLELDRVYLQSIMVPKWVRGTFEYASICLLYTSPSPRDS